MIELFDCQDTTMPKDLESACQVTYAVLSNPNTKPVIIIIDALNQVRLLSIFYYYFVFLCKSPDTQGLKATSRWGLKLFDFRGCCLLLQGLKQGYPLTVHMDVGLSIINPKAEW